MGYFSLTQLEDKDEAKLVEVYERQKGYWIDSCIENQFRLVVHYAKQKIKVKNGGISQKFVKSIDWNIAIQKINQ